MKIFDYSLQKEIDAKVIECNIKIENRNNNMQWILTRKEDNNEKNML